MFINTLQLIFYCRFAKRALLVKQGESFAFAWQKISFYLSLSLHFVSPAALLVNMFGEVIY